MKSEYQRSGGYSLPILVKLSSRQKQVLLECAGASKHPARNEFLGEVENALRSYKGSIEFFQNTNPSNVKKRLLELQESAEKIWKQFDQMDDVTYNLLSKSDRGKPWSHDGKEKPGFTILECFQASDYVRLHCSEALDRLSEFTTEKRAKDFSRINMANKLAMAFIEVLEVQPTAGSDSAYCNALRELMDIAGIEPRSTNTKEDSDYKPFHCPNRDVRSLVKTTLANLDPLI